MRFEPIAVGIDDKGGTIAGGRSLPAVRVRRYRILHLEAGRRAVALAGAGATPGDVVKLNVLHD